MSTGLEESERLQCLSTTTTFEIKPTENKMNQEKIKSFICFHISYELNNVFTQ